MTTPKIDHNWARKDVAHVLAAREDVSNAWLHNLARAYLDLGERHRKLVEAATEYEAFRGQSEPNPAMVALGDRLRAALAAGDQE